jgi:hypothetical protein
MARPLLIDRLYALIFKTFRRKRMRELLDFAALTPFTRVLDVGGYPWFWNEVRLPAGSPS